MIEVFMIFVNATYFNNYGDDEEVVLFVLRLENISELQQ